MDTTAVRHLLRVRTGVCRNIASEQARRCIGYPECCSFGPVILHRVISLVTLLALLAVVILPAPLICCEREATSALAEASRSCCGQDLACCHCSHKKSIPSPRTTAKGQVFPSQPDCACPSAVPTSADVPARFTFATVIVPQSLRAESIGWYVPLDRIATARGAVDSSPPHLAAADHYTFLRTASLLI